MIRFNNESDGEPIGDRARQIAKLANPDYFRKEVYRLRQVDNECNSYAQAYEKVESLYAELFGEPKYSSFKSWQTVAARALNEKRENNG